MPKLQRMRTIKVVLSGVVLLVAIVALAQGRARAQGDLLGCQSFLTGIGQGLARYAKEHDGAYPSTLQELVPGHIPTLPVCPTGQQPYLYELEQKGFKVRCGGSHRGLKPGNPYLDSGQVATATPSSGR